MHKTATVLAFLCLSIALSFHIEASALAPIVVPIESDVQYAPPVSTLKFWKIEKTGSSVLLSIAWPKEMSFVSNAVDVYGIASLASTGWTCLASIDVSCSKSNAVVELSSAVLDPSWMSYSTMFFRMASQDDLNCNGIPDKYEDWVLGGDLLALDRDNDGLADVEETGYVSVSSNFEWHAASPSWTTVYADTYEPSGISEWLLTSFTSMSTMSNSILNVNLSTVAGFETGYIGLSSSSDSQCWAFPPDPMPLSSDVWCSGSFAACPYWMSTLCLEPNDQDSYIKHGVSTDGSYVIEFRNARKCRESSLKMTFQVIVPPGNGDKIYVSYLSSNWPIDGSNGEVVGVQSTKAFLPSTGFHCIEWDFSKRGPILPETTLEFHIGYGTDPSSPDTDGDGIYDGEEVKNGTSPLDW